MEQHKHPGHPRTFSDPKDLEAKILEYYEWCKGEFIRNDKGEITETIRFPENVTITGLALYVGFESRQSFYDYEKYAEYSYIIKRARLKVENEYEKRLSHNSPTGAIFALKNMGWADKQEIDQKTEHSGSIDITWQEPPIRNTGDKGSD